MKHLILALILSLATVANATNNGNENSQNCPGNSCHNDSEATGGDSSSSSTSKVDVDASSRTTVGQGQFVNTTFEGDSEGIKAAGREHAETAGNVRANSNDSITPCGDSSGLSGQVGVAGGGLATITETCRAFRLQLLQTVDEDKHSASTTLAAITYYVGWFPRLLLHVASFGVLN